MNVAAVKENISGGVVAGVTEIVTAYLKTNSIAPSEVPALIRSVHASLAEIADASAAMASADTHGQKAMEATPAPVAKTETASPAVKPEPFVSIEDSIQHDGLICLFDGVKKKMLKRHIRARYGMSWEQYKSYWGLPKEYPSVAPGYSQEKSAYAKAQGLGSVIDKTPKKLRSKQGQKAKEKQVA